MHNCTFMKLVCFSCIWCSWVELPSSYCVYHELHYYWCKQKRFSKKTDALNRVKELSVIFFISDHDCETRWLWWYIPFLFAVSTDGQKNPTAVWCRLTFLGCLSHLEVCFLTVFFVLRKNYCAVWWFSRLTCSAGWIHFKHFVSVCVKCIRDVLGLWDGCQTAGTCERITEPRWVSCNLFSTVHGCLCAIRWVMSEFTYRPTVVYLPFSVNVTLVWEKRTWNLLLEEEIQQQYCCFIQVWWPM